MKSRFSSAKNSWIGFAFLFTALLPLVLTSFEGESGSFWVGISLSLLLGGFLGWVWFATFYTIKEDRLHFRQGPFFGSFPITKIRKIEPTRYLAVGMRPALDFGGFLVHYNKYDKIYISPVQQQAFVEALLKRNPAIEVAGEVKKA